MASRAAITLRGPNPTTNEGEQRDGAAHTVDERSDDESDDESCTQRADVGVSYATNQSLHMRISATMLTDLRGRQLQVVLDSFGNQWRKGKPRQAVVKVDVRSR